MKLLTTSIMLMISLSVFTQTTTWFEIPTNTNKKLNTISFGSPSVGYIGGNDSLLLKTTDGGQTWSELTFTGIEFSSGSAIINLKFVSESIGFMTVSGFTGSFKTTDGGLTWTQLPVPLCFNQGLFFWDEQNGLIGGAGCFQGEEIVIYSDGNVESAIINSPTFDSFNIVADIDFLNDDFGLAVSSSRFLRTTDGGQNWDTITSGTTDVLTSVEIVNDTLAYAGYVDEQSAGYGLLVTHNGGLNWSMETQMATFAYPDYNDVGESANGNLYAVGKTNFGTGGMIFDNTGEGWWFYNASQPLNALDTYGDSTMFAVGDSGLVVTNLNPVLGVSETVEDENPLTVYPNPASNVLNFNLDGKINIAPSNVMIWSLQGQLVMRMTRSDYRVDVSSLSAGRYVLEVSQSGRKFSKPFIKE